MMTKKTNSASIKVRRVLKSMIIISERRCEINSREFVSKIYQEISEKFKDLVKTRFPHITYGQDPNSATFKKSYPLTFKNYFFRLVKSYF